MTTMRASRPPLATTNSLRIVRLRSLSSAPPMIMRGPEGMTGRLSAATVCPCTRRQPPRRRPPAGWWSCATPRPSPGVTPTRDAPSSRGDARTRQPPAAGWPPAASCPTTRWSRPPSAPARRGRPSPRRPAGSPSPTSTPACTPRVPRPRSTSSARSRAHATDVIVIGHNPTIAYLAQLLDDGAGDAAAGAAMAARLPDLRAHGAGVHRRMGRAGHGLRVGRRVPRRAGPS